MLFRIEGTHRSGVHVPPFVVEADTKEAAIAQAEARGVVVKSARVTSTPAQVTAGQVGLQRRYPVMSTGDIPYPYEIVGLVFAQGNSTEGVFADADPAKAYQLVADMLGKEAKDRGANGVIHIRMDYRVAVTGGLLGPRQAFEVFGYGTAVRVKEE
jgi:Putative heavy-metal-binding